MLRTIRDRGIQRASLTTTPPMDPRVYTPAYELFFVLEPVRASFFELRRLLLPLNGPEAPRLLGADVYYREATDVALLALRFDERQLDYQRMTWVLQLAAGAGLPVLDPVRLSEDDRRAFYRSYLTDYELCTESVADVDGALCELGERLDLLPPSARSKAKARRGTTRRSATATWPAASEAQSAEPGEKTRDGPPPPPLPPRLARLATVTPPPIPVRDTLPKTQPPTPTDVPLQRLGSNPPPARTSGERGALGKLAPEHRTPTERQSMSLAEQAAAARARGRRARTVKAPITIADSGPTQRRRSPRETRNARGKQRAESERAPTRPSSPGAKGLGEARRARGSGPHAALADTAPDAASNENAIDVRFLRGGQWVPAALRTLSAKSAYLVTGAPPRVGDSVYIALGYRDHGAMVRATVHHVTTPEDAEETGSSGFAARFPVSDSPGRQQLIELLRRARSDGVTIKPPPSRCAVRFPVEWPVRIATSDGGLGVDALDVSSGGMFVATESTLSAEGSLMFRIPLDTDDTDDLGVEGSARIVRKVSPEQASARGLRPGYGLAFDELGDTDQRLYQGFLSRVRQRNERRILVGAAPGRVEELARELAAVGYAVTAGSDPGALLRLADSEPTPPDVAIIDVSLQTRGLRKSWVEQVFTARSVPCITTRGEVPSRARLVVDRLLQVGG